MKLKNHESRYLISKKYVIFTLMVGLSPEHGLKYVEGL